LHSLTLTVTKQINKPDYTFAAEWLKRSVSGKERDSQQRGVLELPVGDVAKEDPPQKIKFPESNYYNILTIFNERSICQYSTVKFTTDLW
jgi:hypothetical protein